jgi:filamentous hemagglutinin
MGLNVLIGWGEIAALSKAEGLLPYAFGNGPATAGGAVAKIEATAGGATARAEASTASAAAETVEASSGRTIANTESKNGITVANTADDLAKGATTPKSPFLNIDEILPNQNTRVFTEAEVRALGNENKGLVYVTESPRGPSAAQEFQAGTSGSFSDLATQKQAVPALRFDNPNPNGVNYVKFDGIEKAVDGSNILLIDAKTKLAIWSPSTQSSVLDTLRRVDAALAQNPGFKVVYEFPNAKVAAEAQKFIQTTPYTNTVTIRVRNK